MSGAMERATQVDAATITVEAVASILLMLGGGSHDGGNIHMALLWLGGQLDAAGSVLSDGGKA